MELPGEAYLLNLSLVAIGFASVSALVMLLRQMTGGPLTRFDIHLIVTFISGSFAVAGGALVPPVMTYTGAAPMIVWGVSGVVGALLVLSHLVVMVRRRLRIAGASVPPILMFDWIVFGLAGLLLLADAAIGNFGLYAIALTVVLGIVMFAFIRRIASLLGNAEEGFDPHKG